MNKEWFTYNDGVLLLWLLLAHIATDFIFQTKKLVDDKYQKQFNSSFLYAHGFIAALGFWLASGFKLSIWLAILGGVSHLIIDIIKIRFDKSRNFKAFIIDQLAHLVTVFLIWLLLVKKRYLIYKVADQLMTDYKLMLIIIGVVFVIWPASFIIKFFIQGILPKQSPESEPSTANEQEAENAGRYIGIFERVIIFFLVLLGQYQAIGFLITGKSIIRMNSKKQTEYVLVGTLISYVLAICTGILVNWLRAFKG